MITLDAFLLARIAEDEEQARNLTRWPTFEMPFHRLYDDDPEVQADFDAKDHAKTLARLGVPARVLAECEAKRRIVEEHRVRPDVMNEDYCDTCANTSGLDEIELTPWPCPTIRALASVYADHPDYDQTWRP